MGLVERERDTYEAMWLVEDYAKTSPGGQLVPAFLEMSGARCTWDRKWPFLGPESVLDAGCGSGKGALALKAAGFKVEMCDLTDSGLIEDAKAIPFTQACLWEPLKPQLHKTFDWVYCCDVMEHIPTPFVMLAISRLLEVAHKGVFLSIAMQADNFGVWVGKPLHQTVMGFVQWRDLLSEVGNVKECRDMLMNGIYLVEPRR